MTQNNNLMDKAAKQCLCEALGHDEGTTYYLLLHKDYEGLSREFSYSKKYRVLKNLFNSCAVAKLKLEDKDVYNYIALPPTFLHTDETDQKIVDYLEKIYLRNYRNLFSSRFSQLILRSEKWLILFMLKYSMKENAKIIIPELDQKILGKKFSKVELVKIEGVDKKVGIIDRRLAFEFSSVYNGITQDHIGYIASKTKDQETDYISLIENKLSAKHS